MPRKTRSQTKSKSKVSAANWLRDNDTRATSDIPDVNNALSAAVSDQVHPEQNISLARMPQVRFAAAGVDVECDDRYDCVVCDQPNNADQCMVQCRKCTNSYHFDCAQRSSGLKGNKDTFLCTSCVPRNTGPTTSSITGLSDTSSTRRARLARELELLEEARKLEEDAQREKLERERQINEKAAREKIERNKEYLARKRELLNQQDEADEVASLKSNHSIRSSTRRVEDWVVKQTTSNLGSVVAEDTSTSADPMHHVAANPIDNRTQYRSSTPVRDVLPGSKRFTIKHEPFDVDLISAARTTGSITIGDNELDEAIGGSLPVDSNRVSSVISLVDLKPLQNMLEEQEAIVLNHGTRPKAPKSLALPYSQWQSETGYLRKTKELEQRHQKENEIRRKRELELVDQIRQLQLQKETDIQQRNEYEADVKKQLQLFNDRQNAMDSL